MPLSFEQKIITTKSIHEGKTIPQIQRILGMKHCSQIRSWLKAEEPALAEMAIENARKRQIAQREKLIPQPKIGKMPRELRKVSTEVWIEPCESNGNSCGLYDRLGFTCWSKKKSDTCTTSARITLEELWDE